MAWSRGRQGGSVTQGLCFACSCWKGCAWKTLEPLQVDCGWPHGFPRTLLCHGGCCHDCCGCPPRHPQSPGGLAAAAESIGDSVTIIDSPDSPPSIWAATTVKDDEAAANAATANSSGRAIRTNQAPQDGVGQTPRSTGDVSSRKNRGDERPGKQVGPYDVERRCCRMLDTHGHRGNICKWIAPRLCSRWLCVRPADFFSGV